MAEKFVKKETGAKQGRLTGAKAPKREADDWSLEGWLNISKSGKMVKVSRVNGEESEFIGLVSVRQIERLLAQEITGVPIKLPPETPEDSEQED